MHIVGPHKYRRADVLCWASFPLHGSSRLNLRSFSLFHFPLWIVPLQCRRILGRNCRDIIFNPGLKKLRLLCYVMRISTGLLLVVSWLLKMAGFRRMACDQTSQWSAGFYLHLPTQGSGSMHNFCRWKTNRVDPCCTMHWKYGIIVFQSTSAPPDHRPLVYSVVFFVNCVCVSFVCCDVACRDWSATGASAALTPSVSLWATSSACSQSDTWPAATATRAG